MVSGLKGNITKWDLFALKEKSDNLNEICGISIRNIVSYSGIKICQNQKERVELNFNRLIEKIKKKFSVWF